MKSKKLLTPMLLVLMGALFLGMAHGQSLADLARKERARKGQEAKTGRVYTNDDVAKLPPTPVTSAPAEAQTPAGTQPTGATPAQAEAGPEAAKPAQPPAKTPADVEKEYREKFAELREQLAFEEKKLDVMQRELNLAQQQYYSDPNVAMQEQFARTEINQRTQEIVEQRAAVEKAKAAIADLEEELRKKGLPPGWAR